MKKKAFLLFITLTLLTGLIYPLLITFFVSFAFPYQAGGSLILDGDKIIGSQLIGQEFTSLKYFWSRPSVTHYNTLPSNASNLGPTSEELKNVVKARKDELIESHGRENISLIPSDLIFSSGSGLDPHISVEAANFQIDRVAKAREFNDKEKLALIDLINRSIKKHPKFLGPLTINVLELNLALDALKEMRGNEPHE